MRQQQPPTDFDADARDLWSAARRDACASRDRVPSRLVRQTTLRLPDELDAAVEREATSASMRKGDFLRNAIAFYLGWLDGIRTHPPFEGEPPPHEHVQGAGHRPWA
jgi:hypothetical protein